VPIPEEIYHISQPIQMSGKNPILSVASKERRISNHLDKIKLLEAKLNRLTILENPQEIKDICTNIISLKKHLEKATSERETGER
jgi:hypothetical protein